MGLFDKAKDLAEEHGDKVDSVLDKVGDMVDEKTSGEHTDKIQKAKDFIDDRLGGDEAQGQEPPSKLTP